MSQGEYVNWFDSDDLMLPEKINEQLESIKGNKSSFSICLYSRKNKDLSLVQIQRSEFKIKYDLYQDYLLGSRVASLNLLSILFKKSSIDEKLFDERLVKSQEYEYLPRYLKKQKNNFTLVNKPLYVIRRHGDSITGKYSISKKHVFSDLLAKSLNLKGLDSYVDEKNKIKLNSKLFSALKKSFSTKDTFLFFKSILYSFSSFNLNYKIKTMMLFIIFPIYKLTGKGKYIIK
jgi:hypothetical protein